MHKISGSGATVDGRFKESPSPATRLSSDWLNTVQTELVTLVTAPTGGNAALDLGNDGQVLQAILAMITRAVGSQSVAKKGQYRSFIREGPGRVNFPAPFPTGTQYVLTLTPFNGSGTVSRDSFIQRAAADEGGFYFVCQAPRGTDDNSLDGFDWIADPL
ncbi:hypothetical protein DBR17_01705 [Sphingomonas sp. HMWF008]|nr:hypothetical protein DBR17_01705 [Sphingomonas sp. HMWF008]